MPTMSQSSVESREFSADSNFQDLLGPLLAPDVLAAALPAPLAPHVRAAADRAAARAYPSTDYARLRAHAHAKVIRAFLNVGVDESDLAGTSGYGYNDSAREKYEAVLCEVFRAQRTLARLSIVSGTHAIVLALAATAGPGKVLVSAAGRPYDTLRNAIAEAPNSLVERGTNYSEVPLQDDGTPDLAALEQVLRALPHGARGAVFVQRSRGYATRSSLALADIASIAELVRQAAPSLTLLVDNCYCELVEDREPLEVGADLIMGSLIKNLGGGIAPGGGYIAGRADLIERITTLLYAPGLGDALGPTFGLGRLFFQGLFAAPSIVWESLRGLAFAAALFSELGIPVSPGHGTMPRDIVLAVRLGTRERVLAFGRALQRVLPINARFAPEPGAVPGYRDDVIMSGGAFIAGATIELSCDAPLREPYEMYLQGGTSVEHVVLGALACANALALLT